MVEVGTLTTRQGTTIQVNLQPAEAWVVMCGLQTWLNGDLNLPDDPPLPLTKELASAIVAALEPVVAPPDSPRYALFAFLKRGRQPDPEDGRGR